MKLKYGRIRKTAAVLGIAAFIALPIMRSEDKSVIPRMSDPFTSTELPANAYLTAANTVNFWQLMAAQHHR